MKNIFRFVVVGLMLLAVSAGAFAEPRFVKMKVSPRPVDKQWVDFVQQNGERTDAGFGILYLITIECPFTGSVADFNLEEGIPASVIWAFLQHGVTVVAMEYKDTGKIYLYAKAE